MESEQIKPSSHQQQSQVSTILQAASSRFFALVLIWSMTPLAVVWSVRELHPVWALALRFACATPLAWLLLRGMGLQLRWDVAALRSYLAGSLGLFGAMLLCYLGAMSLPSAMIAMIFGLSPLVTGVLGHTLFKTQQLRSVQWIGMLCGLVGMVVAMGVLPMQAQRLSSIGLIYTLSGMLCYVLSMFWLIHEKAGLHPMVQTTGSLGLSAVGFLLLLPLFWDQMPTELPSVPAVLALLFTVVFASVLAMLCYFDLVERIGPTPVALTTILTPVLALCWGLWLNQEQLGAHTLLGMGIVLLGLGGYFSREIQQTLQHAWPHLLRNLQKIYTDIKQAFR